MFDFRQYSEGWSGEGAQFNPPDLKRIAKWAVVIFGLIAVFVVFSFARGIYADWLWFDNLGYKDVFVTILTTKIWLFFAGALVFAAIFAANLYLAHRFSGGPISIALPPESITFIKRVLISAMVLVAFFISVIFGSVASGRWELFLRFMNSVPFNQTDPQFGNDISFYVFTLPVLHFLQGWLLGAAIVTLLGGAAVYFINFSLRGMKFTFSTPVRIHTSILAAALMFLIAGAHWLDRWEILYSSGGAVVGATYADVNARLPVLVLLTAIAVASGILMLLNAYLRGTRLLVGAFVLWVAIAIVGGAVYPGFVQRFSVNPNEFAREREFIERNIQFTRLGFALDRIEEEPFPAQPTIDADTLGQNPLTVQNIRIWDHRPMRDVYNQIQFIRLYYDFLDIDVDRYFVNGEYRQVMLSGRELSPEKLPPEAQRWVNQKLQFTHGFGVVMGPVTEFTGEGRPHFYIQDIPPSSEVFQVDNPRIYYGENTKDFVVVNSNIREFDFPSDVEGADQYRNYTGNGGVQLSSLVKKLVYAWELADVNILISGEITSESRVQYRRQIQERIEAVAPFLQLDADPYIVLGDNRLFWIQDAYTVTDRFPYSEPLRDSFNYIRNSAKIVMDAYNGSLSFYVADEEDPLIKAYQGMFPSLFQPMENMPDYLRGHIRYPVDFFDAQAEKYLVYHMRAPQIFYNREDQWSVPSEQFYGSPIRMEPYYLIMRMPGESEEEFVLLQPFTPSNRPNMISWMAARSDGENYGKLKVFRFPRDRHIDGPSQIEARIDNDPVISQQFTLWGQVGSTVLRGNLLVIPIGQSILYVEPVFLQAEALAFPELRQVIVASGDKVVMEPTLEAALAVLIGEAAPTTPPANGVEPVPPEESTPEELRRRVQELLDSLGALKDNVSSLEEALERLQEITEGQ